ncbi:MAG: hypothetical protein AAGF20_00295 [Pseudomonadota bacterium]
MTRAEILINLGLVCGGCVLAALGGLERWRKNPWWIVTGLCLGMVVGWIAANYGAPLWLVLVAGGLVSITGPATLMQIQDKSLFELLLFFKAWKRDLGAEESKTDPKTNAETPDKNTDKKS